ncbi:acyltransferase family protein [Cryobacterium sp. W22_MBD10_FK3]|uniref:acyltransferase family protein n=1 Tax=Cryobacterium sp. W22_MBD10_FK3 TaxID=3240273 RepID=UPI003F9122FC
MNHGGDTAVVVPQSTNVRSQKFAYNTSLDGLRALAVLAVIAGHAGINGIGGYHGVTVFFVISGYLITSLLMREKDSRGSISLLKFYGRRLARLGPALVLVTLATVVWLLATGAPVATWWAGALGALTYTTDIIEAAAGNRAVGDFQWSWSLSVEEQFYLLWPILLLLIPTAQRWRWTVAGLSLLVAIQWAWRTIIIAGDPTHERLFYAPDTHVDALIIGTIIALVTYNADLSSVMVLAARLAGLAGAVGLLVLFSWKPGGAFQLARFDEGGFGQAALLSAGVVFLLAVSPRGWAGRALAFRPLVFLGKLSYGLYLWNWLTVVVFVAIFGVRPVASPWGIVWFGVLICICYASWRFVETPLRRKWAPAH